MDSSSNNNNHIFLSEFRELRNELSAVKKRIVQLEESHEKQQEKIDILESENHTLKTQLNIIHGIKDGESVLKRKRTNQNTDEEIEPEPSVLASSVKKKTRTNNNNDNDDQVVVISIFDNGDSFDSLSDDLLHKIVEFNGNCYAKFGSINKRCKNIYDMKEYKLKKETCVYVYGTVDMMLEYYLQKRRDGSLDLDSVVRRYIARAVVWYNRLDAIDWIIQLGDSDLLQWVCCVAANVGRIKILTKVFLQSNLTMLDQTLNDTDLCYNAAGIGKLETLKWLRKFGVKWDADTFIIARDRGHDEIVQYLRNEGCPEDTDEFTYSEQLGADDEYADF